MTVTLHSTDRIVTLVTGAGEIQARIWEGHTEQGVACHAFVTRIAVHKDLDASAFEKELREMHAPLSPGLQGVYPARLVI
jgi:hypothetical protein